MDSYCVEIDDSTPGIFVATVTDGAGHAVTATSRKGDYEAVCEALASLLPDRHAEPVVA
jgi:hypothetical protein